MSAKRVFLSSIWLLLAMGVASQLQAAGGISGSQPVGKPSTTSAEPGYKGEGESTVLTFEGLADLEFIGDFYNGGLGGNGSGPGPNFGITFSANAQAIIDADAGGTGNFGGEPSPSTIMFFLGGTGATMNVPAGFVSGFSFFYSAINNPGTIRVFSGPDGTGTELASLSLPVTSSDGGDPTGQFSPLVPVGVSFSGTAQSVDFGGTIDQIGFDNITLGSAVPDGGQPPAPSVPIPTLSEWGVVLLIFLMAGVAATQLRRRR